MKKLMAILLAMIMMFSFACCGNEGSEENIQEEKVTYDCDEIGKMLTGTWAGDVEWLSSYGYYQFYGDEHSGLCAYYRIWYGHEDFAGLQPGAREGFWGNYSVMENGEIHIYWGMEYHPMVDKWEDVEGEIQLLNYFINNGELYITEKMKKEIEGEEPEEYTIPFAKIWDYEETVNNEIPYVGTEWWEWLYS